LSLRLHHVFPYTTLFRSPLPCSIRSNRSSIVFLSTYFSIIYTPIFTPILIRSSEPNKYSLTDILFLPAGCISVILMLFLLPHCTINPSLFFSTIFPGLPSYSLSHHLSFNIFLFFFFIYSPFFTPILIRSSEPNKYSLTDILFLPAGCISVILMLFLLPHCTINPSLFFSTICPGLPSYSLSHRSAFHIFMFLF